MNKIISFFSRDIVLVILVCIMLLLVAYKAFLSIKEEKLLDTGSKQIKGFVVKTFRGSARTSANGDFLYRVNGEEYQFNETGGYYEYLKIGDTVLIEYSVKDHSVARVVDSRCMQKFKKVH